MTEEDKKLAQQLAQDLREQLEKTFVGRTNTGMTRAAVTAFVQGKMNEWYSERKIEFAPLPTIEVEAEGNSITVTFFDPETKQQMSWADWIEKYTMRRYYGRRE